MFMMGRDTTLQKEKIKAEYLAFHDIIMEDFLDNENLDKIIMGMRWAGNYCKEAKFILKANHDVWVNIPRFLDYFSSNAVNNRFFGGKCVMGVPDRNRNSPKYVSVEEYPESAFPTSCRFVLFMLLLDYSCMIF
jgi:hypothetical protein